MYRKAAFALTACAATAKLPAKEKDNPEERAHWSRISSGDSS
jgi:hypothetical protein